MKKFIVVLVLVLGAAGFGSWYWLNADTHTTTFRTVQVERGDLLATVNATGTIEPEEVIDIGAQVAGQILSFGEDPRGGGKFIDFSSPVEKGTELAHIDQSVYQAQVDTARAQVQVAQAAIDSANAGVGVADANLQQAVASLEQMKAKLAQADRDWQRAKRLGPSKALADVDYDTAEATYLTSKAGLAVGEAAITQMKAALKDAQAKVLQAKATLSSAQATERQAEINLGYCTIKSPVKGVIVDRRVNIGQTVVSSLNTPSLFLIAKDLKRLQIWASVNEADIGNIHSGQNVTFTVDAFPDRVFKGVVAPDQPRLNASMNQNVVTFTVVVNTDNSDGKLKPYLTSTVLFEVAKHSNTLLVPNSALRWKPSPQQVVPEDRQAFISAQRKKTQAGDKPQEAPTDKQPHNHGTLWVVDGGFVKAVKVKTGVSDGLMTEIVDGIEQGTAVVVGESRSNDSGGATTNPFAPKMFGGKKQQ